MFVHSTVNMMYRPPHNLTNAELSHGLSAYTSSVFPPFPKTGVLVALTFQRKLKASIFANKRDNGGERKIKENNLIDL